MVSASVKGCASDLHYIFVTPADSYLDERNNPITQAGAIAVEPDGECGYDGQYH